MELSKIIADIEKTYGKGSIMSFDEGIQDIPRFATGILPLDIALGGGLAIGRIIEAYGEEATGKTTLAIYAMIAVQKMGKIAVMIDVEHAFDPAYAEVLGLDVESKEKFLISQPSNGEEAFGIAEKLLDADKIGIIVIDSVAALTPKAELEGDFGDSKMGLHARLMSQSMRKLVSKISKSSASVFFINQMRDQIGVMFGDPKTTTGGNALKFYASQRLRLYLSNSTKDSEGKIIGGTVRVKIVKNKIAPPFKEASYSLVFGEGVDHFQYIVDMGVDYDIIKKSGSWYSYNETKLGQGAEGVKSILRDNPELLKEILHKIKVNTGLIEE
jgi:recombination protein RecA